MGIRTESVCGPPVTVHADLPCGYLAFERGTGHRSTDEPLHGRMSATSVLPATFIASLAQMMGRPPLALDELPLRLGSALLSLLALPYKMANVKTLARWEVIAREAFGSLEPLPTAG